MTPEQIAIAAQFGVDISEQALSKLDEKARESRLAQATLVIQEAYELDDIIDSSAVKAGKRESFAQALEDTFWEVGGVNFLKKIAKAQPLEFAKLAVKLIPVSTPDAMPQATFVFNLQNNQEKVVEQVVEQVDPEDPQ